MIESFSIICPVGDENKVLALLLNINIIYPNSSVYILCDTYFKTIVNKIPFNFTININYIDILTDTFSKTKENFKYRIDYFRLPFLLFEKALEENKNTMYLDNFNIILNKFHINFDECKNKLAAVKMLDSNDVAHNLYLIDSIETINKWEKIIYNKAAEIYKIQINSCDSSQNFIIEEKDNEFENNELFINIYCDLMVKKLNLLTEHPNFVYYLPKENHVSTLDFFRKNNNLDYNNITYNNKDLLFKGKTLSSISIVNDINDANIHKVNSALIKLLININKKFYRLLNLQNNKKIIFNLPPKNNIIPIFNDKDYGLYNLIRLWNKKFTDIILFTHEFESNYFEIGDVILYNYPNNNYFLNNIINKKILIGTLDVYNDDLSILNNNNITYSPWIYWPKHADKVEDFINNSNKNIKKTINSVFIGNSKYEERKQLINIVDNIKLWDSSNNMLDYDSYLFEIAKAKYGICCKESSINSHRLMEYLAVGTVPIIIKNQINTTSFENPLQENIHFLSVDSIENINHIIQNTSKENWNELSENGQKWYMKNIYSENSFKNLFTYFLLS